MKVQKMCGRAFGVMLVAAGVGLAPHAARAVVPEYSILDLGTLGGVASEAHGINSAGQVVGWARDASGIARAFRTAPNSAINPATDVIPTLSGGTYNWALAINDSGNVAGFSSSSAGDRAYRLTTLPPTTINPFRGNWSYAEGINNVGHVVGGASDGNSANAPTKPYLWNGTTMVDLGTFGGTDGWANAINASGQVVGYAGDGSFQDRAFLWTPTTPNAITGSKIDLGTLGGGYAYANGINDAGHVVGFALLAGNVASHAFLRTTGPDLIDLGTLGGTNSEAHAINDQGMVVGFSDTSSPVRHGFLYADGAMHDLNELVGPNSGWTIVGGTAINARAQIAGYGTINGQKHAFLMTALPTWKVDASGNWSDTANWFGAVPSGAGAEVRFTGAITSAQTVTVDVPQTVGRIAFENLNAYTIAGPGTLTFSGNVDATGLHVRSGSHTIAAPVVFQSNATITIDASSRLALNGPVSGAIKRLNLDSSASLDLSGNDLVVDYDVQETSPLDAITAAIATGFNGGGWDGGGISSTAAAADPNQATALGVAEAATIGLTSFAGQPLDESAVIIKYTYYGDTNLDGAVDITDLGALASNWQASAVWTGGDLNYDGFVDIADLGQLATNWQAGVSNPMSPDSFGEALSSLGLPATSVPEPAALALAGVLVTMCTRRRTR